MKERLIKVCGKTWCIKRDAAQHQEDRRGCTYKELQEVRINPSLHPELQETTLIHEILHVCADHVGIEDEKLTEEDFIKRIAPTLTTIIKLNPDLLT